MVVLSHYLQGFVHLRWLFGISSINSRLFEFQWKHNTNKQDMLPFRANQMKIVQYRQTLWHAHMEIWGSGALRWISCDSSLLFVPHGAKRPELHVPMRKRTAKEEKRKGVESYVFFFRGSVSLKRLTMVGWKVAKAWFLDSDLIFFCF